MILGKSLAHLERLRINTISEKAHALLKATRGSAISPVLWNYVNSSRTAASFGHGSRPRGCESRTPRGVKRKAPANSDRRKPYQLGHRKVWTFSVMCLADNQRDTPPSRDRKLELLAAGLGEKKVTLGQSDDYLEVHNTLLEHFPALKSTGYEVMRLTARRQLEVIPSLDMTAIHLKTVFDQAKMYRIDLETVDMVTLLSRLSCMVLSVKFNRYVCVLCSTIVRAQTKYSEWFPAFIVV